MKKKKKRHGHGWSGAKKTSAVKTGRAKADNQKNLNVQVKGWKKGRWTGQHCRENRQPGKGIKFKGFKTAWGGNGGHARKKSEMDNKRLKNEGQKR